MPLQLLLVTALSLLSFPPSYTCPSFLDNAYCFPISLLSFTSSLNLQSTPFFVRMAIQAGSDPGPPRSEGKNPFESEKKLIRLRLKNLSRSRVQQKIRVIRSYSAGCLLRLRILRPVIRLRLYLFSLMFLIDFELMTFWY